ncbi:MAG: C40 family peptidase [Bacteroidales bacterium]|nr:C40 family peptidase [Bacteroidales bacterium]
MTGGICYLSIVPVRSEPSDRSEMVNQLLFGDLLEVLEVSGNWIRIRTWHDAYEGWCDRKQIQLLTDETIEILKGSSLQVVTDITATLSTKGRPSIIVAAGSSLFSLSNGLIAGPGGDYHLTEGNAELPVCGSYEEISETASMYLNAPYLWGGKSPFGIDCSGLVQVVFKMKGINLKRDASQQATQGRLISLIEESRAGDVAFFDNEEGNIIHTGIITGMGSIIHASGSVRIDPLDHHGIYNRVEGKYSHKLRIIRRFTE